MVAGEGGDQLVGAGSHRRTSPLELAGGEEPAAERDVTGAGMVPPLMSGGTMPAVGVIRWWEDHRLALLVTVTEAEVADYSSRTS